jgi:hypothetical protein
MKWLGGVLVGLILILTGCHSSNLSPLILPSSTLPPLTFIQFERTVWALPIGVEIRYPPEISNQSLVKIFAQLPLPFDWSWLSLVTRAEVHTLTGRTYQAIPVAAANLIGVEWYLVLLEDELVEIERLDAPLWYIQLFPVLA